MKTVEQYRADKAAAQARFREKRVAAGWVSVSVTTTTEAAAFIKDLSARLREPGAALESTLAAMLNVQRAPAATAPPPAPAPAPAAPAISRFRVDGTPKPDFQIRAEETIAAQRAAAAAAS